MKPTLKTLATLAVAATFAFAGCKPEKIEPVTPDNPEEPGEETIENIYAGTSWAAHLENTYLYEGVLPMEITYDLMLDFLDTVSGELFHDVTIDIPDYPAASQHMNQTESFTYTFSNDTVVLHCEYYDEEEGDTVQYTYELTYDKEAETLTLDFNDPEMEDLMGSSMVVFTPLSVDTKTLIPATQTRTGKLNWHKVVAKVAQAVKF